MKKLGTLICHIPARKGSKRVPSKNLRFLGEKPLIAYAIECAKNTEMIDEIYVNTDSEKLCALAKSYGVKSYLRDSWLASDDAKGDDFTADFMENVKSDTLLMINPVCPLLSPEDIADAIRTYEESDCDTLIACEETQMQVFFKQQGVNIDADGALEPTQKNTAVQILNWAVAMWNTDVFMKTYREKKKGYLGTNRIFFPIEPIKAVKISNEKDFRFAEMLIRFSQKGGAKDEKPRYWSLET